MLTASNSSLKQSCSVFTSVTSALKVNLNVMRSINLRFTYLLTYSLTCLLGRPHTNVVQVTDFFAAEDVDVFAEFVESFFALNDPGFEFLLGTLTSTRDSSQAQLQYRVDALWPREQRRVQLQILRYTTHHDNVHPTRPGQGRHAVEIFGGGPGNVTA